MQVGAAWTPICASAGRGLLQEGAGLCTPHYVGRLVFRCTIQGMHSAWIMHGLTA